MNSDSLPIDKSDSADSIGGWFPVPIVILSGIGLLMVYSASLSSRPGNLDQIYVSRHLLFLLVGGSLGLIASRIRKETWKLLAPWLYGGMLLLLAATLIPKIGIRVNGAQRWIRLGSISVQPSELAKIGLPLFLCFLTARAVQSKGALQGRYLISVLAVILPVIFLVAIEPDLGTAVFLIGSAGIVLFVSGWPLRYFIGATFLLIPAGIITVILNPYQWKRVTGFLETYRDLSQAPYQLKQSLVALGSGGVSGVGFGHGTQKLSFLPEANNDFVFSVVGEELGLIGTIGILVVWSVLFFAGWIRLKRIRNDRFAYPLAFTLLAQVLFQAAFNIAVVVAVVPPKGISHPLLSSGGSGLLVTLIGLGMVYGLSEDSGVEGESVVIASD